MRPLFHTLKCAASERSAVGKGKIGKPDPSGALHFGNGIRSTSDWR
ncbi:hypothetical protein BSU04_08385 [Caballeronia sordidicola]|uniref:Uncharacterized protein n=1 Tax=Caballeronia sordidicola TaxID=196367 RepID=A0A226X8A0_CABSO|nr:hypothetical protein BSU04_08385 [Caballeronia sordidicola]